MSAAPTAPTHLGVLVPVRDEERLLGRCLRALAVAAAALAAGGPGARRARGGQGRPACGDRSCS